MDFLKVELARRHLVGGVLEIIAEELEVFFVDLEHKVHRQIVEIVLDRMRPLGSVAFALVEAGNLFQIDLVRRLDRIEPFCIPGLKSSVQKIWS